MAMVTSNVQIALGLLRNQYPWVYDAGIETIRILRSRKGVENKRSALRQFDHIVRISLEHPAMREIADADGKRITCCGNCRRCLRRSSSNIARLESHGAHARGRTSVAYRTRGQDLTLAGVRMERARSELGHDVASEHQARDLGRRVNQRQLAAVIEIGPQEPASRQGLAMGLLQVWPFGV